MGPSPPHALPLLCNLTSWPIACGLPSDVQDYGLTYRRTLASHDYPIAQPTAGRPAQLQPLRLAGRVSALRHNPRRRRTLQALLHV